jgi:mannose-6-phosphate isomerase-like protein (cupin superfamily)
MTHTIPPTTPEHGASIIEPPFHYHIHQSEKFHVRSGTGNFYKGLDPKPFATLTAGAQETAFIPAGLYHRFENASKTEPLVVDIHLTPENYQSEQQFFRNFFGYLDDCKTAKTAPSLFQLLVFLHRADTPLALPLPWHWLGVLVSRVFLIGVAGVGRWILGYQSNYVEYYEEEKSK